MVKRGSEVKMATLKDISEYLGLSVTQVSRALNGHSDVNQKTRKRVEDAAKKLKYSPNIVARKLVSGKSGVVGLVSSRYSGQFKNNNVLEVVTGLSTHFANRGMQFVLHVTDEEDILSVYEKLINGGSLDGFVIVEPLQNDIRIKYLSERGVPFVVHGRSSKTSNHPYFDIDNYGLAYLLTTHLAELGHKHIAFINGLIDRTYSLNRLSGYKDALEQARLPFYPHLVYNGFMNEALGMISTVKLFGDENVNPTAVISGNILIAKGVYTALNALDLEVPRDVSVVAHDDVIPKYRASAFYPALTVTRSPLEDSWGPMAKFLSDAIDKKPLKNQQQVAKFEFVARSSTDSLNTSR